MIRNFKYGEYASFGNSVADPLLDRAIEWIRSECKPDDIFDELDLEEWARNNRTPNQIFDNYDLESWAEERGYIRETSL